MRQRRLCQQISPSGPQLSRRTATTPPPHLTRPHHTHRTAPIAPHPSYHTRPRTAAPVHTARIALPRSASSDSSHAHTTYDPHPLASPSLVTLYSLPPVCPQSALLHPHLEHPTWSRSCDPLARPIFLGVAPQSLGAHVGAARPLQERKLHLPPPMRARASLGEKPVRMGRCWVEGHRKNPHRSRQGNGLREKGAQPGIR